ncbi:hypothetical protein MND25_004686 [Vibrio parahaemolyticus]|nr:hypothetical protein [Vibrio parahaemolyticus]
MQLHPIRIIYLLISLFITFVAYYFHDVFLSSESSNLDYFSYIGTVATLIGLLVAIFEVFHSIHLAKSIQEEASTILTRVKSVENASTISDCISAIDDVNSHIAQNDFKLAVKSFQYFRKLSVKTVPGFASVSANELSSLSKLELSLSAATHSTAASPLNKGQKQELAKEVLLIKQKLEDYNPARGENNAAN